MNSLVFLLLRSMKNSLLELLHKPAKLALWLILILMLGGFFAISIFVPPKEEKLLDPIWLQGGLFMVLLLLLSASVKKGLSTGDTLFGMNDVNLLFVSPIPPRTILMYGIARMAKVASGVSLFLLFQGTMLKQTFGIGFESILPVFLGFILAVSLLQIISIFIYSLTSGNHARKRAARLVVFAVHVPLALSFLVPFGRTHDFTRSAQQALSSSVFAWTPVTGWAAKGAYAFVTGDAATGLLLYGMMPLAGTLLLLRVAFSSLDYYEDVLIATETAFERKRAISEGQINPEFVSTQKVVVAKTGIGGHGASVFLFKHLRESFRINRLGLWGTSSFLITAGAVAAAFFLRGKEGGIALLLQFLMWMQLFVIGTGRGLKELYSHYIYMIPDGATRKVVWSNLEIVMKVLVESVAIFVIAGIVLGAPPLRIVAAILVYTLFSFLLLGVNYLSLRWTGASLNMGLLVFLYMFAVVLIMLPGLIAAIIIASTVEGTGILIGMLVLALWELLAGLGCFALSRGILHHCDMPSLNMLNK